MPQQPPKPGARSHKKGIGPIDAQVQPTDPAILESSELGESDSVDQNSDTVGNSGTAESKAPTASDSTSNVKKRAKPTSTPRPSSKAKSSTSQAERKQARKPTPPPLKRSTPPTAKNRRATPPPAPNRPKIELGDHGDEDDSVRWIDRLRIRQWLPSVIGSFFAHLVILILIALIFIRTTQDPQLSLRSGPSSTSDGVLEELSLSALSDPMQSESSNQWSSAPNMISGAVTIQSVSEPMETHSASTPQPTVVASRDLMRPSGLPVGGGLEGRTSERRSELGRQNGATEASESAVEAGLAWLALHQRANGAWWFDHHDGDCKGRCDNPGTAGSSTASTGLALLAFLGAGYTPESGPYRQEVRDGIYYLLSRVRINQFGGDLREGSMYGHGIATLALCEAYAMTGDQTIRPVAQQAVNFIVNAQHKGGGWRYTPGQPGDTTVFGWQFMALKSAQMAGLDVPTPTIHLARYYLDSVASEQGARYGYLAPGADPSPTAIGLLCRMYLGWRHSHPSLHEGVEYLFAQGISDHDLYFNYYATQVLHHYGGQMWSPWNETMRDMLVETQSKRGHENGSWYFRDEHGDQGGRLYNTAMAIMILEVYYRYMPLYSEDAVEHSF